ncbi:DUF481 domain-containing protein [Polaribacter marinivivus]|uniref:DUF481 domain-containing protein n=1 Tax=Polaribacter marinivivus TaxID=1524260 RepID=UPI003D351BCB
MKKIIIVLLLFPSIVYSQLNESDTLNFKARLSLTGFWQGGNVETIIFRASSDISFKPWKNAVFNTKNSYVYQEFGKVKADEDILSLNFLYLNPQKKIYPLILGFVSTNFRREIDLRYLFGAGVTFQVLNSKKNWLKFSVTSEYENTNFSKTNFNDTSYNGDATINTMRGTIWMNGRYHLFKDKLILNHESYYQPSLEQRGNYRWQADVSLELPIWKFLNFKINYLHTFESVVIANQKQEDRFLTFGLTLKSY